ncbi:MAG: SpoIIE family protein phosphatase [Bryobacteraceae bacterium]|nr:SpoIIE family protein phosphatase [Bryobacteraceae bacterium]
MTIRIGRPEWTFAALLLSYVLLSFIPGTGFWKLVLLVAGAVVFLRMTRRIVKQLLWRLRNRLITAYIFIALVPVVLITLLSGLGVGLLGGQLSIYLVTSELERRTSTLRGTIEFLARDDFGMREGWAERVAPVLESRNPGLELLVQDRTLWSYPADARLSPPPAGWKPGSGLLLKDGRLYGWAHTEHKGRRVIALVPITREFLGTLAPDVCESSILDLRSTRSILHESLPGAEFSHNRFPPAVNRLDFEIDWGSPIPVHLWEQANQVEDRWLTIRTRPSAVLRTIFSQKIDWASDVIPLLFFVVGILFLIAEIIALIIGVSLTKTITGAIHDLYVGTLRASASDFQHRIPIRGKDQLAELAVSFNQMTSNMERLLIIEKERERLQTELEIAREVQNQLYPRKMPSSQSLRLTAACNPARMVSGDYYDYQQVGTSKIAIAIGDVAGKGISAALLMATVQSSFRSQLRACADSAMKNPHGATGITVSTSGLVSQLNQQLYADTSPEKYATFYLGVFDEATSELTYTNAGHLPPVLVHKGEATRLDVNGMVVGAFPFAKYEESRLHLVEGDLVVFFTDGISEPENAYGEMFGEEQLTDLIVRNAHRDESEIIDAVMSCVREWTGAGELQDDMTLLLVRRQ